jgi:hypothetical protein
LLLRYSGQPTEVVFEANDRDETLPGPWEWDVKWLATSMEAAARGKRVPGKACRGRSNLTFTVTTNPDPSGRPVAPMTAVKSMLAIEGVYCQPTGSVTCVSAR